MSLLQHQQSDEEALTDVQALAKTQTQREAATVCVAEDGGECVIGSFDRPYGPIRRVRVQESCAPFGLNQALGIAGETSRERCPSLVDLVLSAGVIAAQAAAIDPSAELEAQAGALRIETGSKRSVCSDFAQHEAHSTRVWTAKTEAVLRLNFESLDSPSRQPSGAEAAPASLLVPILWPAPLDSLLVIDARDEVELAVDRRIGLIQFDALLLLLPLKKSGAEARSNSRHSARMCARTERSGLRNCRSLMSKPKNGTAD